MLIWSHTYNGFTNVRLENENLVWFPQQSLPKSWQLTALFSHTYIDFIPTSESTWKVSEMAVFRYRGHQRNTCFVELLFRWEPYSFKHIWKNEYTTTKLKSNKRLIQLQLERNKLLTCKECDILLIARELIIDLTWLLLKTFYLDPCPVVLLWTKTSEQVPN